MPVYEYQCEACDCRFQLRQGFDDDSVTTCPTCKSHAQRVFLPVPIIFKGTGFYITDSRGKNSSGLDSRLGGGEGAKADKAHKIDKEGSVKDNKDLAS
ncbi:FmdB family zinc ribbon protein [Chloroflexota bacterium]